jgi:TRAP-type C4-dicarboxylate transport system permease small subunit
MDNFIKRWIWLFEWLGLICLFGVAITASVDVFNRVAAGASIAWAQKAATWLNLFVICLIGPIMVIEDGHIRVRFVWDKLRGVTRTIVGNLNDLGFLAFCAIAIWGTSIYTFDIYDRGITRILGTLYFPYWPIAIWLPLSFFFFFLAGLYVWIKKFRKTPPAPETSEEKED